MRSMGASRIPRRWTRICWWRDGESSQLRRDNCPSYGAVALSVPVRGELCEVWGLPGYRADGREYAGGATVSRRNYGETIAHLTAPSRYPYQFAANYAKYGGFPDTAPMDANMLVALIAPRPVLLQTGSTDNWSDPRGEFLAAVGAGPVYKLLGKQALGTDVWPAAKVPLFSNGLNYYMHEGPHGMVPTDWDIYVQFLKAQFHPEQ